MNLLSKKVLNFSGAILLALTLLGCTTYFQEKNTDTKSGKPELAELPPVTIPITPALVKLQKEQHENKLGQDLKLLFGTPAKYVIGAGDVLSIIVWDHPELGAAQTPGMTDADAAAKSSLASYFVVDHEGIVQFPYSGKLTLAGLTVEQARDRLATTLSRYIHKPNLTLRVQDYRSKRIYIDGDVKTPGLQSINDISMTLIEALNRAGGLLPTGDQSQIIINRAGKSYQINLLKMMQKGINPASIMLVDGDIIRILSREENKVFVSGEVTAPKALLMHNGRLTLNEALGESGGINPITADGRQVYVVRKSTNKPVVYQLDASSREALALAEGFELHPKDVVYVAASPLANWNRAISLLFPGSLSSAYGAAK